MDEGFPDLTNALFSQEPGHIPGFMGHIPGLKFTIGKPYGMITAELLSKRKTKPEPDTPHLPLNIPDGVLKTPVTENIEKARFQQRSVPLPAICSSKSQQPKTPKPPQTPMLGNVFLYKPSKPFIPPGNPYQMDDDDPQKYFIPGYSGHVPFFHSFFGKGFSLTTNQALIEYGRHQRRLKSKERDMTTNLPTFYASKKGVVPGYTGHIPEYRFMFGHSYGHLSKVAMEKNYKKRTDQEMPH